MAGLPRAAKGAPPPRKQSIRPAVRPPPIRIQSSTRTMSGKSQTGEISPTDSVVSTKSNSNSTSKSRATSKSRSQSPPSRKAGGTKRKERDFEDEGNSDTNIHVVVRCRGRNDREVKENSGVVVSTDGVKGKNVELSMGPSALSNKTYHFDKVFSPAADQIMIYEDVVAPILNEMLQGFNCTIFAYGQTGTGKTYTMSGDMSENFGMLSDAAGIIPRVLHSLFTKLEANQGESSVKCSFIELYNEELRDLLATEDNTKLKIFEDGQKKGHSGTFVQGMEESHIENATAGIMLLQEGSIKRQVAATKCNDLSSRSHTIFTVTVYTKRVLENGEDFVSVGKLNLVDLAGSENIQRSGAENKRAAEAGLINKSLLTLGRVINALVDKNSHIPYRESKLTRLLQDSLGGRTKTCIIATVSPAKSNLEETVSTLDYAFRAKNIRNKPQTNQLISKYTLLREFTAEIEKLKSDLVTTRQRNGVYLTNDNYEEMTVQSESRRILNEEQKAKIETMETNLRNKVQDLFSLTNAFNNVKKDNERIKMILDETKGVLEKTEFVLANTRMNLAEETMLRKAHQSTENQLLTIGDDLITTLGKTVTDVGGLRSKIQRKSELESANRTSWESSQAQVTSITHIVESRVHKFQTQQEQLIQDLSTRMQGFVQSELDTILKERVLLQEKLEDFQTSEKIAYDQSAVAKEDMNKVLEEIKVLREEVKQKVGEGLNGLSAAAGRISAEVISELERFNTQLYTSYHSLGRDFKGTFEELVRHLNTQKAEADDLRKQLSVASNAAMQANKAASSQLEACLIEERQQASADRQNLLSQITSLINASGEAQDTRLTTKIDAIQQNITSSTSQFEAANAKYAEGMDTWNQKEKSLVDEVVTSRDHLKAKMQQDWTAINEQSAAIQAATQAVHCETVRIVDAQMKEMAGQMQALDQFVSRARAQNGRHHDAQVRVMTHLGGVVKAGAAAGGAKLAAAYNRTRGLGDEVAAQTWELSTSLPPLDASVRQPLGELRMAISEAPMAPYVPTGETPQRVLYQYPSALPRTAPHEQLLASRLARVSAEPALVGPPSPSKSLVFADQEDEILPMEDLRPAGGSGGLREVSANMAPHWTEAAGAAAAALPRAVPSPARMLPPPSKRRDTREGRRLPGAGAKGGSGRGGGENVVGGRRRLRSSPTA